MANTQTREEWLELRRQGITGTDVAKILGRSKWGKALDVYRDKLGLSTPSVMNPAMLHGIEAEPRIIGMYSEKNKITVAQVGHLIHPKESWIIGNPDGIVVNEKGNGSRVLKLRRGRISDIGAPPIMLRFLYPRNTCGNAVGTWP